MAKKVSGSLAEKKTKKSPSFHPPAEPDWHRMISEAAYYCAERRGFEQGHALEDWLAAEDQVRAAISQ
jgi:Protein of unknown function (DUF2934)